jgi:cystathionine gamma-synthase
MPEPIKVISQQPPGGRCPLYALYAEELSSSLGLAKRVIY